MAKQFSPALQDVYKYEIEQMQALSRLEVRCPGAALPVQKPVRSPRRRGLSGLGWWQAVWLRIVRSCVRIESLFRRERPEAWW